MGVYIEPFCGSAAILLARPDEHCWWEQTETINDADGMVANFWRAVTAEPDAVADYADWPVNENDLHARHIWLVGQKESLAVQLEGDADYYDAKIAGWWCWGMCCWIGSGFCSGKGPWQSVEGQLVHLGGGRGINRKLVHLGNKGVGINRQLVHLSGGQGINRKLVHLGNKGVGINRQLVHLGGGRGINRKRAHLGNEGVGLCESAHEGILDWMCALQNRLRRVRVCSGDWERICGSTPLGLGKYELTGVFLDPPYSAGANRTDRLYATDSLDVALEARTWAIEMGDNPQLRIALCGYEDEYTMPDSWQAFRWKAAGGYGSQGDGQGKLNAKRETIWFSPHCLKPDRPQQLGLEC